MEPASVNAELSWKTVTKGVRSANRRPRKINQSLNMGLQHNVEGAKHEPSVTESEKFGVAVLGNRFSEKIDHLPIKKRRLLQRSLPPLPCIPFDKLNWDLGQESKALDGLVRVISNRDEKSFLNIKPPCSVDSYGIELLATAACNTSINEDVHNVKVGKNSETLPLSGASVDATLLEENNGCFQKENTLLKDSKLEDHVDSRKQNNLPVVVEDIHVKSDSEAGKGTFSGKDIRLHWDLNTVMDEWELPPGNICTTSLNCPLESNVSAQVISKLNFPDKVFPSGSDPLPSESPFLEKLNTPTTKMTIKVEDRCRSSDLQLGQRLALENVHLEKQGIAMVDSTISENLGCNVVKLKLDEDKLSDLPNGRNTKNLTGTTFGVKDPSNKSGKVSPSFAKNGELAEKGDLNIPPTDGALAESSSEVEVKKREHKRYDRVHEDALDDILDDGDVSDYSPSGNHHLFIIENMTKHHSGYESPVEDGELRESFVHSWQENEGETDCLDYDASGKHDSSKESSQSVTTGNSSGRIQIYEDCEHVKTVEENNVQLGELGGFDSRVKGSLGERVVSREKGGKMPTHRQGFSGSRDFDGTEGPRNVQRSSAACYRDRQVFRSEKFGRDGDVSGNWGSGNHYQSGFRRGGSNLGRRSNNSPGANDDHLEYDYQRRSRNNYTKGGYPLDRRRPPDNNHNLINRDNFATKDDRFYESRGRSEFYRRGYAKDNINESHDHISNNPTPFYNRDNSFSRPYRKSPSRSRTRSPVPWHLQRERNVGLKRMSRSPNFRSEGRMGRNYDDLKFSGNEDGFLSPLRKRYFNNQNSEPAHFRERNSPGRFVGQRQRFGSNGSVGIMKTDDGGFRPRLNSERFSEKSGGGLRGRNNKYNNNYDGSDSERRRYNNNHDMICPVRRRESGDAGRRFRSDADKCFEDRDNGNEYNNKNSSIRSTNNKNSCVKSTEKSDAPGNGNKWKGDKAQLTFDGDNNSKLPEIQSCEDDLLVSRG